MSVERWRDLRRAASSYLGREVRSCDDVVATLMDVITTAEQERAELRALIEKDKDHDAA